MTTDRGRHCRYVRGSTGRFDQELRIHLTLAGAPREPGNDRSQVVRVDGLGQVDLKPSQQRQVCVVLLDERGQGDGR